MKEKEEHKEEEIFDEIIDDIDFDEELEAELSEKKVKDKSKSIGSLLESVSTKMLFSQENINETDNMNDDLLDESNITNESDSKCFCWIDAYNDNKIAGCVFMFGKLLNDVKSKNTESQICSSMFISLSALFTDRGSLKDFEKIIFNERLDLIYENVYKNQNIIRHHNSMIMIEPVQVSEILRTIITRLEIEDMSNFCVFIIMGPKITNGITFTNKLRIRYIRCSHFVWRFNHLLRRNVNKVRAICRDQQATLFDIL